MAFKSKGRDAAEQRASEAEAEAAGLRENVAELREAVKAARKAAKGKAPPTVDTITALLSMEDDVRAEAANYPAGANSDAVKSALTNAAHGIAHVRKALKQVRMLGRDA